MKKLAYVFLVIACFFLAGADYLGQRKYDETRRVAGMPFQITIFDAPGLSQPAMRAVAEEAFVLAGETLSFFSIDDSESDVARINAAKIGEKVVVRAEVFNVLSKALRVSKLTDENYTFADTGLSALWLKAKDNGALPSQEEVESLVFVETFKAIELDADENSVKILRGGFRVDVSSLSRAYAVEKVAHLLKEKGVSSAVLVTDKVIRAVGLSQEGRNWRFGIEHPRKVDGYAALLEFETEKSVATTGDYDNFFIFGGKRYALPPNPRSGYPADSRVASVTVLANDAALAVALSQAFFFLGPEKSFLIVEKLGTEGVEAVFIEEAKSETFLLSCSEGVQANLKDIDL